MSTKFFLLVSTLFLFSCINKNPKDKISVLTIDSSNLSKLNASSIKPDRHIEKTNIQRLNSDTAHFKLLNSSQYEFELFFVYKNDTVYDTKIACYDKINDKLEAIPDQNFNRWKGIFKNDTLKVNVTCQFTTNDYNPERTFQAFLIKNKTFSMITWDFVGKKSEAVVSYFPLKKKLVRVHD